MHINFGKDALDMIEERIPFGRQVTTIVIGLILLVGFVWAIDYLLSHLVQPIAKIFNEGQWEVSVGLMIGLGMAIVASVITIIVVIIYLRDRSCNYTLAMTIQADTYKLQAQLQALQNEFNSRLGSQAKETQRQLDNISTRLQRVQTQLGDHDHRLE